MERKDGRSGGGIRTGDDLLLRVSKVSKECATIVYSLSFCSRVTAKGITLCRQLLLLFGKESLT